MILFGTNTSPYVRKVRIVAEEIGLGDRLQFQEIAFADPPAAFADGNPLRRVPTLISDDGMALFDSPVIAEWLDTEFGGKRLLPAAGAGRWATLRVEALADGLLDSATSVRHETQRETGKQSQAWIDKQLRKVRDALAALEADDAWRGADIDLGQIAVAAALGYLQLRFKELLDRARYPTLIAWFDAFSDRPSMIATAPA